MTPEDFHLHLLPMQSSTLPVNKCRVYHLKIHLFLRESEREHAHERAGEGQRETENPKKAVC